MSRQPAFRFACPRCRSPLRQEGEQEYFCPAEGLHFLCAGGIWRFLLPEREPSLAPFMRDYENIRLAERRGSDRPEYYRALPFQDLTGRFRADWGIRARSYRALLRHVIEPAEGRPRRLLHVLDMGAGNGWLAARLAGRGHSVAAIDLMDNHWDGLGAHRHYDSAFLPIQAEFDRLPFLDGEADLAIFNAAFHYSTDYTGTLHEILRVLRPRGSVVVLDTPVYRDHASGERMVAEREQDFRRRFGFASNALPFENYLTWDRLDELGQRMGLRWRTHEPWYGLRWALRPWSARLRGGREPARFLLIEGRRS